jgi:hypothetical protein
VYRAYHSKVGADVAVAQDSLTGTNSGQKLAETPLRPPTVPTPPLNKRSRNPRDSASPCRPRLFNRDSTARYDTTSFPQRPAQSEIPLVESWTMTNTTPTLYLNNSLANYTICEPHIHNI